MLLSCDAVRPLNSDDLTLALYVADGTIFSVLERHSFSPFYQSAFLSSEWKISLDSSNSFTKTSWIDYLHIR